MDWKDKLALAIVAIMALIVSIAGFGWPAGILAFIAAIILLLILIRAAKVRV